MANNKCEECGCTCKACLSSDRDVQLHVEIENLKQRLVERENHIVMMETNFLNETSKYPAGEFGALKEDLLTWQDKYKRLYEAHRRVQRVNQGLEDKLLKLVDVCETEKNALTKDIATLSRNLADANYAIKKLTLDNERYKNDVNLAIQFLQCKQTNFVAHRFDSLPSEVQTQVAAYMTNKRKPNEDKKVPLEPKSIKVPIPTFPPTAMVYSVPKSPKPDRKVDEDVEQPQVDIVSAAIMAKVLEERQKERALTKHCDTCTCAKNLKIIYDVNHHHVGTQTGNSKENVCLKCNELIPQTMGLHILKPVDDKSKRLSPYPNLTLPATLDPLQNIHNIVKVQPNNFLVKETKSSSLLSEASNGLASSKASSVPPDSQIIALNNLNNNTTVTIEIETNPTKPTETSDLIDLQDDNKPSVPSKLGDQQPREPRYASMRLNTGSKNILLDNSHSTVTPILYTRSQETHAVHNSKNRHSSSQTVPRHQKLYQKPKKQDSESTSSSESKQISLVSENSAQHQQRINDWVQITVDHDNISSPDNSRTEDLKADRKKLEQKEVEIKVDRVRYAEMEENVKRFLFGESEFLKTVEIGKLKYKSLRDVDKGNFKVSRDGSKTGSHTETDI